MQNTELRRRVRPVLDALRTLALQGRTPVLGLRKKSCPYHSWDTVQEDPATAPGWTPFAPGDAIGGVEAHYCFRGGITAPAGCAGRHLVCLVSTGATDIWNNNNPQFLAYLNGALLCGLDVNHTEFDLTSAAAEGQTWQLGLYTYCNTPAQDVFLKVETAVRDDEITGLYYDLKAPYEVLVQLDEGDTNAIAIGRYLEKALDMLDLRDPYSVAFYASVAAARRYMKEEFYESFCQRQPVTVDCVGHTHIDVAWLWTLAQTREKAIRSFATVNYLMDRYPEYKFLSSQPQLYDFVRKDCPALFEKIRARVADGHWEPEGGMWLESDCNMASGESLIRQFLHGQEFFGREFGKQGHILWLPDAFGFSGRTAPNYGPVRHGLVHDHQDGLERYQLYATRSDPLARHRRHRGTGLLYLHQGLRQAPRPQPETELQHDLQRPAEPQAGHGLLAALSGQGADPGCAAMLWLRRRRRRCDR